MTLADSKSPNDKKYYYLDEVIGVGNHPEDPEARRASSVLVKGETCAFQYGFQLNLKERHFDLYAPTRKDREQWVNVFKLLAEMAQDKVYPESMTPFEYQKMKLGLLQRQTGREHGSNQEDPIMEVTKLEPYQNRHMILTAHGITCEGSLDKKKGSLALNFCKVFIEFKDETGIKLKSIKVHEVIEDFKIDGTEIKLQLKDGEVTLGFYRSDLLKYFFLALQAAKKMQLSNKYLNPFEDHTLGAPSVPKLKNPDDDHFKVDRTGIEGVLLKKIDGSARYTIFHFKSGLITFKMNRQDEEPTKTLQHSEITDIEVFEDKSFQLMTTDKLALSLACHNNSEADSWIHVFTHLTNCYKQGVDFLKNPPPLKRKASADGTKRRVTSVRGPIKILRPSDVVKESEPVKEYSDYINQSTENTQTAQHTHNQPVQIYQTINI